MPAQFQLLLVEDEPADALLFQDMLAEVDPDIVVQHVEHGQEALDVLTSQTAAFRPDLVVLDLNMPVMGGHEFLERAKAMEAIRHIPVLVLSTSDHAHDIHQSYDRHASGYVVKPSSYEEYNRVLDTIQAYWRGLVRLPSIAEIPTAGAPGT